MARKTFNEKLNDSKNMPQIIVHENERTIAAMGGARMLVAPPIEYDALIRTIPAGKLTTGENMRKYLANKHGADGTCPLTCGIFVSIVAHASEERNGVNETPYWRVVKKNGELNEKFPGGLANHRDRLLSEGHEIIEKGKKMFVKDFEKNLIEF